jgi:hypothetical protein
MEGSHGGRAGADNGGRPCRAAGAGWAGGGGCEGRLGSPLLRSDLGCIRNISSTQLLYGKSWELNLLKPETNLRQLT